MEHSFQLIAERAKAAKSGNYETINLLYNLHYELHPESNDNDFVELTYAISATVRAAEMGIPSPVPIPAGFVYTPNDNKTDDPSLSARAKELIKLLRAQLAPEKPYADIIQEVALSELETALYILGEQYCWFAEPNALRGVRLGLQERINEYTLSGNANDKHIKIPRLEHAINWLQSYEKQLVTYLEKQADILTAAAPATAAPPRPGSPALETPAATVAALLPPNLAPNKIRFCNGFSPEDADRVAFAIELVDVRNNYIGLPGVAPGRLCGFYKQLKDKKRVSGSLENLRDYFAERYLKRPVPSKPDPKTYVALDTATETQTALERLLLL